MAVEQEDHPPAPGINSPEDMQTVTPSDSTDLRFRCRVVYVGVTGDIACQARDNSTVVVFKAVPAGAWFQMRTNRIMATNTTATNLIAGK
jgi:hypothetical protein